MIKRHIIAVDFDGTIVEHKYPDIGRPVPGAISTLKELNKAGHRLILYTMRGDEYLEEAVKYCNENGVYFWSVNGNPEQHTWTSSSKTYANFYIDDAALGCPLRPSINNEFRPMVDWEQIRTELNRRGVL